MTRTDMLAQQYPRVLVFDVIPFNRYQNTGILKSSLFDSWPKDRLAQVFYGNIPPGIDVCSQNWLLTKTGILSALVGRDRDYVVPILNSPAEPVPNSNYDHRPAIERAGGEILPEHLRLLIGEGVFRLPTAIPPALRHWIDRFDPEIIFSITASGGTLRSVVKIAEWRQIPILPYFTDDWVSWLYDEGPFSGWLRQSMLFWFDRCLSLAPLRLVISDAMAREYRQRYGGRYETIMHGIDVPGLAQEECESGEHETTRFLFVGTLEPERWRSLQEIAQCLLRLNANGVRCQLDIYSLPEDVKRYGAVLDHPPVVRLRGTAASGEVAQLRRAADVLVHVESFEARAVQKTRFSVSTKIAGCLAAGRPILAYGPAEVASCEYLRSSGAGICVGKRSADELLEALRRICCDADLRRRCGQRARILAVQNHELCSIRERFRSLVCRAIEAGRGEHR